MPKDIYEFREDAKMCPCSKNTSKSAKYEVCEDAGKLLKLVNKCRKVAKTCR